MVPTLVANPADDQVFAAFAQLVVDHGTSSITDFQRRLRTVYPHATVHARELAGEALLVWYVYRDGHWVRPSRLDIEGTGSRLLDGTQPGSGRHAGGDDRHR
jgi:hypothetical protein